MPLTWPLGHKHDSSWMSGRQPPSTSPGAAEQEAATSKDTWADNMITRADSTSLKLGGGKAAACYCAGQIRRNKSPVPSPPVAPRRMQQSCSSMTCHKHEGKHTRSNTLQRGRSLSYCLWEFTQQQLMAFHVRFTEPLSGMFHLYLVIFLHSGAIVQVQSVTQFFFFVPDRFTSAMHRQFSRI